MIWIRVSEADWLRSQITSNYVGVQHCSRDPQMTSSLYSMISMRVLLEQGQGG